MFPDWRESHVTTSQKEARCKVHKEKGGHWNQNILPYYETVKWQCVTLHSLQILSYLRVAMCKPNSKVAMCNSLKTVTWQCVTLHSHWAKKILPYYEQFLNKVIYEIIISKKYFINYFNFSPFFCVWRTAFSLFSTVTHIFVCEGQLSLFFLL